MKTISKSFIVALAVLTLSSCGSSNKPKETTTVSASGSGNDGLNLKALTELAKTTKDPKELEEKLNEPNSINNLDLDNDGNVDYLTVTEYGDGDQKGFSITDELPKGEKQEVATIEISKDPNNANSGNMYVNGNEDVYGQPVHYQSGFSVGEFLLFAYIFRPHPFYYSPWHYGYYPGYWGMRPIMPISAYRSSMHSYTRTTTVTRVNSSNSRIKSPNAGTHSSYAASKRSLSSPSGSQRSFSSRSGSKPVGSGGFGNKSGSSSSHSAPSHSYTPSHSSPSHSSGSSRSFGGSRSGGFGRRR